MDQEPGALIMLTFDEAKHEYAVAGTRLPSVTQILAPLIDYSMISEAHLEAARALGSAVHKATELDDQGILDEDDLSPQIAPYLKAWRTFRADAKFVPVTIEKRMAHPFMGFAGTSDRTGEIGGRLAVIDIKKMMQLGPVIGVQLAAYKELHEKHGDKVLDRFALGLRPDGSYRLQQFTDSKDLAVFYSLLNVHHWKAKNGK